MVNNKIVVFEGSFDEIIEKILEGNGLREDSEDWFNKTEQNEKTRFDVLLKFSKGLASEKITEINFLADIQQQLNISEQVARNILKEVKEKLLPLARILSDDEIEMEKKLTMPIRPVEQTTKTTKILPKIENEKISLNTISDTVPPVKRPVKKTIKKNEIENTIVQTKQQKRENDTYREIIE